MNTSPETIKVFNVTLPNKPLSNFELLDAVKQLKIKHFRGIFMRDQLPNKPRKTECGILNLDDFGSQKDGKFMDFPPGRNGTHWVCWYKKDTNVYYFDSYGIQPPLEINKYFGQLEIQYNTYQFQPAGTVICGHLCLYILKQCSINKQSFNEILNTLINS